MSEVCIEIGGGTIPAPGYRNLDPVHGEGEWRRTIQGGIPVDDGTVDKVRSSHVFEHIPAGNDRITAFNEIHRVLRPGGSFELVLPLVGYTDAEGVGHGVIGWMPWADPTHVSYWWFPESLLYFCEGPFKPNADYGVALWNLESWEASDGWEGRAVLRPVK